jgi:hypothetical protein
MGCKDGKHWNFDVIRENDDSTSIVCYGCRTKWTNVEFSTKAHDRIPNVNGSPTIEWVGVEGTPTPYEDDHAS